MRILLVEDNPLDCQIFQQVVEKSSADLQVEVAGTLAEALERIDAADVLVVDLHLPDGMPETTIKTLSERTSKPMLIYTSGADLKLAYQSGLAGVAGYVFKGHAIDELLQSLHCAVGLFERWQRRNDVIERFLQEVKGA